tara:strand:+ start:9175 stop:9357 length:183 start_codon:yes stop_codon:yes gene_type:complete
MDNNIIESYINTMNKVNKTMELANKRKDYIFLLKLTNTLKGSIEILESLLEQEIKDRFTA